MFNVKTFQHIYLGNIVYIWILLYKLKLALIQIYKLHSDHVQGNFLLGILLGKNKYSHQYGRFLKYISFLNLLWTRTSC